MYIRILHFTSDVTSIPVKKFPPLFLYLKLEEGSYEYETKSIKVDDTRYSLMPDIH